MMSARWLKIYTDREYDRRELISAIGMLAGLIWICLLATFGWRVGIVTSMAAIFCGAAFGCYRTRRTERGVWMLAAMIGLLTTAFYAFTVVMEVFDVIHRRTPPPWWLTLDYLLAGMIVGVVVRASVTVLIQNRKLEGGDPGHPDGPT